MTASKPTGRRDSAHRSRSHHRKDRSLRGRLLGVAVVAIGALFIAAPPSFAEEFPEMLKRVDHGLQKNPSHVSMFALESCRKRRDFAVRLYEAREIDRAERSLRFCFDLLKIPEKPQEAKKAAGPDMEKISAKAAHEVERALELKPDVKNGLAIYRGCARCHKPEGWGLSNGTVPQIAGQHRTVIIKQLADIRAGNRDNPMMLPYASVEAMGGVQAVADVAAYIDTLEISVENGKGPGTDLELGERLYRENCARCHGAQGEGNADEYVPRIQAQHFRYLMRQFKSIREGKRRNANAEMVAQIQSFGGPETEAVLDYVSRLEPPEELQAPPNWRNPDFTGPGAGKR